MTRHTSDSNTDLLVDAGNTSVKIASRTGSRERIEIQGRYDKTDLASHRSEITDLLSRATRVAIASVSPATTEWILGASSMVMPRDHVKIIGKDIHCPIKYKYAGVPGIDRRVNALAAIERYKTELIVVSAGSAITIDLVTETDGMLGGFILPGFRWAFRAVTENAELVNHQLIFNELASASLGYDTATCLSLGIRQGLAGAVDALIDRIQTHLAVNLVILTGGDARLLAGSMRADYCVDDDLTFHGIACCLDEVEKPE